MDINDLRSLVTLLSLALFVGLMWWTWRPSGRAANEAAAQLPFVEPIEPVEPAEAHEALQPEPTVALSQPKPWAAARAPHTGAVNE